MRNKFIKLAIPYSLLIAIVPTNIFTYATTDIEYVEQVYSTVDLPELQLVAEEDLSNNIENKQLVSIDDIAVNSPTEGSIEPIIMARGIMPIQYDETKQQYIYETITEDAEQIPEEQEVEKQEVVTESAESVTTIITTNISQENALLEISNPDENYTGAIVELSPEDRNLLEHLVMGESGGIDVEAAALVAQAIRDAMVYKGYESVAAVREGLSYSGSIKKEPNQNVLDACAYIFDEGGMAVQHEIIYFYAPKRVDSSWHESQNFIIEYGGHRFFSSNK